jgi:hypothetical protein
MFTKENKTSMTLFGKESCMKINKKIYGFIFLFVAISSLKADTRIVLTLRHAPEDIIDQAAKQADAQNILNSFANFEQKPPSKLSRKMIKGQIYRLLQARTGRLYGNICWLYNLFGPQWYYLLPPTPLSPQNLSCSYKRNQAY